MAYPTTSSSDPARDSPDVLKRYLEEFHPDIIGLTGEYEEVKNCCKVYRVYFSTPPHVKPGQDYLVDHSIYFYLMGKLFFNLSPRNSLNSRSTLVLGPPWKGRVVLCMDVGLVANFFNFFFSFGLLLRP